jgi:hypothetical protein
MKKLIINFVTLKKMKKMKKNLIIALLIASLSVFAQEKTEKVYNKDTTGRNEFRIGTIHALTLSLNANYERILDKYFGFGVSLSIINNYETNREMNNDNSFFTSGTNNSFILSPYYRFYFSERKEYGAHGFFIEGYTALISGEDWRKSDLTSSNSINKVTRESFTTGAIGFGAGKKWVNHKGFVFEFMLGVGRGFSRDNLNNEPRFIFKGDFSVGYRF